MLRQSSLGAAPIFFIKQLARPTERLASLVNEGRADGEGATGLGNVPIHAKTLLSPSLVGSGFGA